VNKKILRQWQQFKVSAVMAAAIGGLACDNEPGPFGNSVKNFYDYVCEWFKKRFNISRSASSNKHEDIS